MSISWTKSFSSADDGTALTGQQLADFQSDINSNAVNITDSQTVAGNKTWTGTQTFNNRLYYVIQRLSSTSGVNMSAGQTLLYTVSASNTAIFTHVIIRGASATLSDGTDYDFGSTTLASGWIQNVSCVLLTNSSAVLVVSPTTSVAYMVFTAGSTFYMKVGTGTSLNSTAVIDLFGVLL